MLPPARGQQRQREPGDVHGGEEVNGQRGEPVLRRDRREAGWAGPDRADVVDQDVQAAECPAALDHHGRAVWRGQIGDDRDSAEFAQLVGALAGNGDDAHALADQPAGDGQANAPAGAGDDGGLTGQCRSMARLRVTAVAASRAR